MVKRFQNKISGSRFLLATVAVITVALWFASGMLNKETFINLAVTAFTAYFLVELDTRNSIIRIYSRMFPSAFLVLTTMSGAFIHNTYVFTALLWALFLNFLFSSYQDKNATGRIFYAFLFLGLSSILFVQTLYFLPVIWFLMLTNIMSLSRRTFAASVIGILLPYWFIGGYSVFKGDLSFFPDHFYKLAEFGTLFGFNELSISDIIVFAILLFLSATGIIHYIRNSNKDKIRTRMFCETTVSLNLCVLLYIALQPCFFVELLPILIITTSALIAHYIVLTNTKWTNISVFVIIALVTAITIYNLWIS